MTPLAASCGRREGELTLDAGAVHVWTASLDGPPARTERLGVLLSADERERAARFHFDRDRHRFVTGRGRLRELVGMYLERRPERVEFRYGPLGKPALAGRDGEDLRFNVSHSGGVGLFAFSRDRELGIDVELLRQLTDADQIADGFFSPREAAALRGLPEAERPRGFFECWTRKEAYLKATGGGLASGLGAFAVSLGEPARLEWVDGRPDELSRWWLSALHPAAGYVAALAVEGTPGRLVCWPGVEDPVVRSARDLDVQSGHPEFDWRGNGREGRQNDLQGRREPRGAVLDLARGARERSGLA